MGDIILKNIITNQETRMKADNDAIFPDANHINCR
jgi:hypothetical protein